jgi:hypothetical protein
MACQQCRAEHHQCGQVNGSCGWVIVAQLFWAQWWRAAGDVTELRAQSVVAWDDLPPWQRTSITTALRKTIEEPATRSLLGAIAIGELDRHGTGD